MSFCQRYWEIKYLRRRITEGNGNPLQYSCLENLMDRGAWQATVHGVARVGHNLVTKPPPPRRGIWVDKSSKIKETLVRLWIFYRPWKKICNSTRKSVVCKCHQHSSTMVRSVMYMVIGRARRLVFPRPGSPLTWYYHGQIREIPLTLVPRLQANENLQLTRSPGLPGTGLQNTGVSSSFLVSYLMNLPCTKQMLNNNNNNTYLSQGY